MSAPRRSPAGGLRIVVGGAFARAPANGGLAWMVLQYVLGLRRLGHEVLLVERLSADELTPRGTPLAESDNARWFFSVAGAYSVVPAAVLLDGATESAGLSRDELRAWANGADLLLDIAGGLSGVAELEGVGRRLYLDVDPGFTQLWQEEEGIDMRLGGYDAYATVGLGFDRPGRTVPDCGRDWIPTPPPVVLEEWPWSDTPERFDYTTIANFRGYGSITANGRFYGQKAHSLRRIVELPRRSGRRFTLALAIDPAERNDLEALRENGWRLVLPSAVAASPADYRRFVRTSRGELGVAKSGYVEGRCGWFSDRSVCYLASGRPVMAQDTGFRELLPVGEGLFAWDDIDGIEAALEALDADYGRERRAARALAEEYFDSDRVLPALLDRIGATP
jgi:hypothetical protein